MLIQIKHSPIQATTYDHLLLKKTLNFSSINSCTQQLYEWLATWWMGCLDPLSTNNISHTSTLQINEGVLNNPIGFLAVNFNILRMSNTIAFERGIYVYSLDRLAICHAAVKKNLFLMRTLLYIFKVTQIFFVLHPYTPSQIKKGWRHQDRQPKLQHCFSTPLYITTCTYVHPLYGYKPLVVPPLGKSHFPEERYHLFSNLSKAASQFTPTRHHKYQHFFLSVTIAYVHYMDS